MQKNKKGHNSGESKPPFDDTIYHTIFENSSAAIAVLEADATITMVNTAFCSLSGYTKEELTGTKWSDKLPPEEVERLKEYNRKRLLGDPDVPEKYETLYVTRDNQLRTALFSVSLIKPDNKIILTFIDITDRKVIEQAIRKHQIQLNIALKIARLGSWELDLAENLFYFNDTFYAIFETSTQAIGSNTMSPQEYAERFIYPEDRYIVGSEIKEALETKDVEYTRQIEHRMLYANGKMGYLAVRFAIIKNERGETVKIFGINQDITKIRESENKLKESEASLLEINSMKDKFFSIIAHDLKSPFSAILGLSEILAEEVKMKDYDNVELHSNLIFQASTKAYDLLINLMEWSRSETGKLAYLPKKILLIEIVNETIELLTQAAQNKNIKIEIDVPDKLYVHADFSMLSSILRNLISNAIKFTFKNGRVKVSASEKEKEAVVKVADNGTGMSNQLVKKLFRIDENTSFKGTEQEEGTGLGLILCKEFVEKHGGNIWVESEEGKGSAFYFSIPKMNK